jgi:hypothetical protein
VSLPILPVHRNRIDRVAFASYGYALIEQSTVRLNELADSGGRARNRLAGHSRDTREQGCVIRSCCEVLRQLDLKSPATARAGIPGASAAVTQLRAAGWNPATIAPLAIPRTMTLRVLTLRLLLRYLTAIRLNR